MLQSFKEDYYRMTGRHWGGVMSWLNLRCNYSLKYLLFLRKRQSTSGKIARKLYVLKQIRWNKQYGLDIQTDQIGKGLYLGHAHNINVNPRAVIGDNCNLAKGVTIGQENRGERIGAPKIGNRVWIGTNAVVVGNITVGDDVLIAPNCYVNRDIPAHSVVIGNPCKIINKENATEGYVTCLIETGN